jgi:hypothetical protein
MIKLTQLLKEIKVLQPVPTFKTNDELASYLKKTPSYKKQLVDALWATPDFIRNADPNWENVLNGWYNTEVEQYTHFTEEDEILLDDGQDNRAYISIHPMNIDNPTLKEHKIKLGPNIFYWIYT